MPKPINEMMVARRKEARGAILMMLDQNRGMQTAIKVGWIVSALGSKPELAAEVPEQIAYLESKGYIKIDQREDTPELRPIKAAYILLTCNGQDVVEGTTEDPGIIFGDAERA